MKLGLHIEVLNAGYTSQAIYLRNFLVPLTLAQLSGTIIVSVGMLQAYHRKSTYS
jgi:hypothetical protein